MPILVCYTRERHKQKDWDKLVQHWGERIQVAQKDICLNVITDFTQAGANYKLLANLYLPSLWPEPSIKHIQKSFLACAEEFLDIQQKSIFLMTQIIQSGHVIDRGSLEEW